MVAKTCSIHVQRPIDSGVVGPNATSGDYHCQPESSEDGVSQCEPSRGLFRSLSHGGSGRVKLCRLGHTPNRVEKGRQKLETQTRKWREQRSARFGARESYLFGRNGWRLIGKFGVRTFPARMFARRDSPCRPLALDNPILLQ